MKKRGKRLISVLISVLLAFISFPSGRTLAADKPDYRYGNTEYYSTVTGEFVSDSYYYSDQWFLEDAGVRNDSLALVSAQLSLAAVDDTHAVSFLKELGFDDASAERYQSERPDDCAYTIGSKVIEKNGAACTLIAVAFQGSQYGLKGWRQNMSVNSDTVVSEDHAAYSTAADIFLTDLSGKDIRGDVIVWLTGYSRGAAVANLAAAYLQEWTGHPEVFACTFGSPAATSKTEEAGSVKYKGIHNYYCEDDPLAMLPIWGMTRYGQTVLYDSADVKDVTEQLRKQNPDAYGYAQEYNTALFDDNVKAYLENLKDKLAETVPTRESYSEKNTDRFSSEDDMTQVIEYTYQEGLKALCQIIFNGGREFTDILPSLLENDNLMTCLVYSYLEENYALTKKPENKTALLRDAVRKRWIAADELYKITAGDTDLMLYRREDLYALLKILSPLIIDTEAVEKAGDELPAPDEEFYAVDYLNIIGILRFKDGINTLAFSHHSDIVIARLKLLAPDPGKNSVADCERNETCPISRFKDSSPESWYHDGVHWVLAGDIMNGVGEDRFAPADAATRAMVVTVLWRMENQPKADFTSEFKDVPAGQWYTDAVNWAAENDIVKGYSSDSFGGTDPVTREQFVEILDRFAAFKELGVTCSNRSVLDRFEDRTHVSDWAADSICRALEAGIIQGVGNDRLSPEANATRAQIAVMIMRYSLVK